MTKTDLLQWLVQGILVQLFIICIDDADNGNVIVIGYDTRTGGDISSSLNALT